MTLFVKNRPLLDAYRRGESSAFEAIYAAYGHKVVTVLRHGFAFESRGRRLRFRGFSSPLDLESFTQEVFLRIFSEGARKGYDGLRPFEPYLLRIARNRIIDEIRRRQSALERLVGPLEEEPDKLASDEPPIDERLDAERARKLVCEFVSSRPERERSYIRARFVHDLSQLAAARELGIGRMRARLLEKRLLAGLRKHLERAGYVGDAFPTPGLASLVVV